MQEASCCDAEAQLLGFLTASPPGRLISQLTADWPVPAIED